MSMRKPKLPRASSNPLEHGADPADFDPDFQEIDEDASIQKGMPARNLKQIGLILLLAGAMGLMLFSQKSAVKPKEVEIKPATDSVVEDLIGGLKNAPAPYAPTEIVPAAPTLPVVTQKEEVDERLQAALVSPMAATDVQLNQSSKLVQQRKDTVEDRFRRIMDEQGKQADAVVSKRMQDQMELMRQMGVTGGPGAAGAGGAGASVQSGAVASSHEGFLQDQARASATTAASTKLMPARSAHTLYEGTIVRVTLTRALKTDLPGMITAKVQTDLYDTLTQKVVLVPRGSEITCNYQSSLMVGQKLVLAACNRLRMPNGKSFSLHAASASDMQGASGLPADIDNHFWEMFKNALIVGAASYLLPDQDRSTTAVATQTGSQITGSILGTTLGKVVDATIGRNINIPPTGTVAIGTPFTLTLSRDVELEPYFRP